MKPQHIILSAALFAAATLPALAQTKPAANAAVIDASVPGKASVAAAASVSATVEAIDKATRQVTLKGPKGTLKTIAVGPDVRNFDQIKVGDMVVARYYEALTLTLKKDGKELRSKTETPGAANAGAGQRPAGAVGERVEITADVIAVNAKSRTITLKGPQRTVDMKVSDPAQFKLIKVGDQIQAVYTEAMAISVEPAKKK